MVRICRISCGGKPQYYADFGHRTTRIEFYNIRSIFDNPYKGVMLIPLMFRHKHTSFIADIMIDSKDCYTKIIDYNNGDFSITNEHYKFLVDNNFIAEVGDHTGFVEIRLIDTIDGQSYYVNYNNKFYYLTFKSDNLIIDVEYSYKLVDKLFYRITDHGHSDNHVSIIRLSYNKFHAMIKSDTFTSNIIDRQHLHKKDQIILSDCVTIRNHRGRLLVSDDHGDLCEITIINGVTELSCGLHLTYEDGERKMYVIDKDLQYKNSYKVPSTDLLNAIDNGLIEIS